MGPEIVLCKAWSRKGFFNLKSYNNLVGMVFVPSGIFTTTESRQAQKASSALYMIKTGLLRSRDFSINPLTAGAAYIRVFIFY